MVPSSWWLVAGVAFGCASSPDTPHPSADAPVPVAGQALPNPAERALPDAGLTLRPMVPPGAGTIPEPNLELQTPNSGGAGGIRAPQNDAPPPAKPGLRTPQRPYSPTPPKPDSQGRMSAPTLDPNAPTMPVQPKGPSNTNAPPADR